MTPTTVNGIDELKALVGQTLGPSDWREITQEDIDKFADVSGDHQWIHVDVERAKTESPFGTTIAHGNLTLCLCDSFREQLFVAESGFKMGINYGWNKVRYTAPVPAGSRIRNGFAVSCYAASFCAARWRCAGSTRTARVRARFFRTVGRSTWR